MSKTSAGFALFKLSLFFALLSCSNKSSPSANNNEFKATILLSNGTTISINATGKKALMGCAPMGGGTYVDGTNESNAGVYLSVYLNSVRCVEQAGTYPGMNFGCQFRPDVTSGTTPIFTNNTPHGITGSITFVTISNSYMEGSFNAVCYNNNNDSVIVNGTFKGDQLD